jgi:RNA polymerase sigma-70 factor (ECF subfamily)
MSAEEQRRLSEISTHWSLVFQAHQAQGDAKTAAQTELLLRYCTPIYRYVLSVVRDVPTAEDLCQEFAHRFVRGDFHRAHPDRGRFRSFIKTAIVHLIADHRRRQQAKPNALTLDSALLGTTADRQGDAPEEFEALWRADLLDRAWEALARVEQEKGGLLYSVLRLRAAEPALSAAEMAEHLGQEKGQQFTVENIRQILHRAREKFSELLLDEVARSLGEPSPESLREEATELGLLTYCQDALDKRGL